MLSHDSFSSSDGLVIPRLQHRKLRDPTSVSQIMESKVQRLSVQAGLSLFGFLVLLKEKGFSSCFGFLPLEEPLIEGPVASD